jgi:hypothetical protein
MQSAHGWHPGRLPERGQRAGQVGIGCPAGIAGYGQPVAGSGEDDLCGDREAEQPNRVDPGASHGQVVFALGR